MIRSFRRQPKAPGGNGGNEASSDEVGVYDGEGPPVPIPNTEVKLVGGENTCLATDREDSTMPTQKRRSRKWPPLSVSTKCRHTERKIRNGFLILHGL